MKSDLMQAIEDCVKAVEQLKEPASIFFIEEVAREIADCFNLGNKVIIAGNGGSLCDAAHFAEELTGFFRKSRKALPAIALTDPGHITCTGNDLGFEYIFSRGVEAYGKSGDIFIGLSTSGNSPNIVKAIETAKQLGMKTVSFLGKDGGVLKGVADYELNIQGFSTSDRAQEAHMAAMHLIIEIVEKHLFTK